MRRFIVLTCVCWFAMCMVRENNIAPLAFGMTPDDVAAVLGAPLAHVSGRRGSELYVAQYVIKVGTWHPADERVTLQFRRNKLTGWKYDWRTAPPRGLHVHIDPAH
jgi:outer membrane protein assembly factor BamE (lipoprotein component of BamABCDE complex)